MNSIAPKAPQRPQPPASVSRWSGLETHPILRAAFAVYLGKTSFKSGMGSDEIARELWPHDIRTARVVTRGAVDPMTASDHEALSQTSVGAFFSLLPQSAAANLIAAGLPIDMGRGSAITLPFRADAPNVAPFVGDGQPIPVRQGAIGSALFGPLKKAATIVTVSREVARTPGAEAIFRRLLVEDAALTLDSALFSDAAADDDRPAGLLHGVTPISGTAGGDVVAMRGDMGALAGAVSDGGGSGALAIIMHPKRAARLQLLMPDFPWPVWPSRAVAEDQVIALDPTGFAAAFGDGVQIDATQGATLHMSSTPAPIVSEGGPAADPVRSLWQTDSIALRMETWMEFCMRGTGLVQSIDGASW